jgi:hypothetical protein
MKIISFDDMNRDDKIQYLILADCLYNDKFIFKKGYSLIADGILIELVIEEEIWAPRLQVKIEEL